MWKTFGLVIAVHFVMRNSDIKTLIIFLLLIFLANITFADQIIDEKYCDEKDLSAEFGPVRNQGNIGWCYANVAADLMTYQYKKELNGARVSAGYIALAYNEIMLKKPNDDSGDVVPAILAAEYFGVCTDDIEDEALKTGPYYTVKDKIDGLVYLKQYYDKKKKNPDYVDEYEERLFRYLNSDSLIKKISKQELESVLQSSTKRTFPRKLADKICESKKKKIKLSLDMRFEFFAFEGIRRLIFKGQPNVIDAGKKGLIKSINKQLSQNKPAAASYNANIFYEKGTEYYEKAGPHVSTIVGRRWNKETKTCEFKLRNSWGKNCYSYTNPELDGKCDPETGYLWLSSEILSRTVIDNIYFKDSRR